MTEPRVSLATGGDPDAILAEAMAIFQREGVVVIDDVIDPALLARYRGEIEARYPDHAVPDRRRNYGSHVGRHTVPLRIDGPLAEPAVVLPRPIEKLVAKLLGPLFMVDSFGLLVAFAGAPDQKRHADAILFGPTIDHLLPPFAIALAVPLITMDEDTGRTAFWRRSHRRAAAADAAYDYAPTMAPGSVALWDYRVAHCGLANRTDRPRPVLFSALSREWWGEMQPRESDLYDKLQMSRAAREGLPPRLRARLNRATLSD